MGRLTKSSARQLAAQTPHLGGGGRLWRRTAAAAAGGRAAGLTLSAVRVFARLFSPKLFAVAFVLGGALSAQSAFAFGAVSSVGRFLRGRMRGVGASGFPLSAVRGFLQLFSPKLFAVAFVLCGALSAQSAFAFGAIAAGGSGSNPSHGIAINQATRAGADAEAIRLCEVGGADCHLIRRFINLCAIAVADSDATTDLAGIPSGTLATGGQAQAAGFYSHTYPSTANANTARTQAVFQCTNFGGTSCAAIAGASGCDTTNIPSCPAGQGVDIVESSICGVCPLVRPIVHTTGPGGTAGVCRAAFNQGECTALDATYHYVNTTGACRVRVAADCTSFTPIYVSASNTCRAAANDEECKAKDPTLEKVGDRCLNICTSGTQVRDSFTGGCRTVENASDCTGTPTPIFVSASTTCRAATNQAECTALTGGSALMFDGGACRDRVASDCAAPNGFFVSASKTCRPATQADCDATTATPILQNGACRAATNQGECSALTGGSALVFDGGACRDRVAGDCAGTTPIFVSASKTCREALQADCTGNTPILDNGACRTRQMNDCPNHAPVLEGGVCRPLQLGDTFGAYYSYERQFVSGGATLRFVNGEFVVNQASPTAAAAAALQACQTRFNNANGTVVRQCEETVVGGFNDMCIDIGSQAGFAVAVFGLGATPAAAAADRIGKFPAGTNFNSATRAGCDCGGTTPIPDGNTCKAAATQAECTAVHAGLVFESGTGTCRPRTASECTGNTPILGNDGVCRAATKEECAAIPATPVSNDNGGCREATNAGECPSARPFFDNDASGKCRAPHSGDNYGAYYHFTRFGGINNGGISFNHPTQEAANAAAKAACESRRDDFGSGTSACNPHPRVRNGFTQCINTAETGPVRYVGLGATPLAARLDRQAQPGSGTAGHNNNNPQNACNCGDGETPDGDNCRPTTSADCTGLRPIFDGGNCRARTPAECPANRPIVDATTGNCREMREVDCTGNTPILDGITCRAAANNAECLFKSRALRYDGAQSCRAATQADCTGTAAPIFDANSGACRVRIASDCSAPTPDISKGVCVAACAAGTPVRDATSEECRATIQTDCDGTGTPILDGTACRAAVQTDCDGTATPILDGGVCRARNAADCTTAAAPVLDSTSGNCRAATTAAECPFGLPILAGGVCRAATQADCTNDAPVLDIGGCRAPRAGDTFGAYYTFTAGSQLINGRFVVNQPTPEAAATEARRACEAVRAGSIGGLFGNPSACAPDSSAPNGFNGVCINTGEVGPRRFVGYGATPAAALAARAAQSGNRNVNFPIDACDCSASQIRSGNDCQPRTSAATCSGDTPIFDRGFCREVRAEDCSGNTPIFDGGVCRGARPGQGECTGRTPIADGGACRAAVSVEDCAGVNALLLPAGDGSCRPKQQSDCTGLTPILDGGLCRAMQARDCVAPTPFLDLATNQCREAVAADCGGDTPIFDSNTCRAAVQADCDGTGTPDLLNGRCYAACPSGTPVRDSTTRLCRIAEASDCGGGTPVFEGGNCRAQRQDECTGTTPILDGGACRGAATDDDCGTINLVLVRVSDGSCRERVAADCVAGPTPIFDEAKICRAALSQEECTAKDRALLYETGGTCRLRTQADCTDVQVLDGGVCRARVAADCTGETPILEDGQCRAAANQDECTAKHTSLVYESNGSCRTRVLADCTPERPILDATRGVCREVGSADCPSALPIFDTGTESCRAARQADCDATPDTPILDGGRCRAFQASDCPATHLFENNGCRARTSADCTGATPRFDRGYCFAESAFSQYGALYIKESISGSTTYEIEGLSSKQASAAAARTAAEAACVAASPIGTESKACTLAVEFGSGCIDVRPAIGESSANRRNPVLYGIGATPAEAFAARLAAAAADSNFHDWEAIARTTACNCGGAMPIADGNSCRAAIQADCTGNTPILASNGTCRGAGNQAECTAIADNLQFDSGACRPRTAADCAATEVFTGAVCRARQTSDCTGTTPILENGNCRAATSNLECSRKSPNLQLGSGGACAERDTHFSAVWVATFLQTDSTLHDFIAIAVNQPTRTEADRKAREACEALNEGTTRVGICQQLVVPSPNNQCVDLRRATLSNGGFKFASGVGATPDLARQNREINSGTITGFTGWRSAGGSDSEAFCDCGGSLGSVASGTGSGASCRAREAADCTGSTPVLEGGVCRAATIAECTTDKPILQNGACRARIDADCTGTTSILENNACRPAANQAECTAKHTRFVFARGGICRERTKADCSAALPVLDAVSGQCRARVASDCTGFTPALINGICQPGMHGAVAIGTIALNISPVNLGALTNPAHPQYSTANGTIQVYGASRLQKSAADARRLALSACGRAASDHRAAAAGQTGQNCQIVSQFASGVAALWRLATAPYGDHYFSAIATLQINTTTTIATMTMAQNTITTTTTMAVAPTNAEIAAAQSAAEAAAKTACDTFAAAQTSTGQTLTCQSAAAELLRTIPAAEVCGEGAFLDADAIPRACACLPGYDTLVAPSGGLPSCSLSANTPRCDNSKGAFLNADATACVCSSGWGALDATATPQFCRPPQCDGPSAFLHPTSGRCECAQGYDNLRHSVDAGGNAVFTCIPTTPPTCRADRGTFFNPLEARCDCQTGWENVRPDPSAANTFMCMRIAEADCDSTRGAIVNPNYGAAGASQCQCANGFRNLQTETANGGNRYFCEFDPNPTTPIPTCDAAVNLTLNAQRTACECVAGHRDLEGRVPPEACAPVVALCDITKGAFPTGLGTSCECAPGYGNLNEVNTPQTCTARCDDDTATLNSVSGQCECKEGFSDPQLERTRTGTVRSGIGSGLIPFYSANAENDAANLRFVCAPDPTPTAPRPVCDESRNAIYSAKHNTCVCRVGPSGAGRPEFGLERKFDSSTNEYYCETANYLTGREGRLCDPSEGSHTNPLVYAGLQVAVGPCVCDIGYSRPFREGPARGASGVVPPGIACTANTGQFDQRPRTELPVCSAERGTRLNADRNNCECIPGYHGNPLIPTGCIPANIPQSSVPDCDAATAQINPRNSRECQCKPGFFNLDDRPAFRTLANGLQVQTPRYFCSSAQEIQVMVSPNPGFSGSDCTAAGFGAVVSDVRYRLPGVTNPVDGQREVCNIDWAEVSADNVPELSDGSTPHVPPANTVNEGTSCVIQQFYKSGENYVSVPLPLNSNLRYCSDLFGGPARAGSLTNISVYAEARAAEINGLTPGTTLVAVYQPSHRLYVATGGGLYTQNGLQINNVPFVIDFVEGFSGADCVRDLTDGRNLGWRATLDLTQNGADRVFRLHCLVDWRETANPPPLRIEAEPPAGTAQGDRCLLGQQPADTPLAANERRCSDMLASACEAPGDPLGCFALIYTAIYDRIWQYNPILSEPETRDFPVVSPTNLPTLYVSGGKVYNANGIESAGPLRFSPVVSGFEPADCSRGGWRTQGDITRTSDGDYVLRQYCNVRWRRVPTPPVQGDVITPPTTITAQGERCLIRQSPPGITLAADLELCSDLLGKAGTNFGAVGDEIDLLTEQANLGRAQNIPTPMRRGADTRGSHPLFILPDGRVFSQYGVGTPILDFVGEVSGFARDDCTNAGYRYEVRVTNTAAGESVQLRTCGVPWARAASPPVLSAIPAGLSPSARLSLSSSGDDCVIEYSPARLSLPPGTEKCSDLLSPGGANFGQITARIEARRAEINPLLAEADAIPAFTRNSTLIIADGRAFTNTGIEVRDDAVAMSAPAAGYGISDCEAGGWTAMTVAAVVDNKPVIRQLCNVGWRESATPPPFGGTPAPDATKMGDHCTIAHTDSTVTDLLLCSDLFGRAAGGVGTFADLTLRAELRRAEVNALSSESALAGAYAVGVNTLYALSPRGLFTDQGVEISDRTYQVSGADDGWKFADCQQAGRTVGITVSGTGLERVVYQFCELNWARTAAPPPLATMQAIPTATASGAGCLIAANPPTTTPPANLERCNLLFATEENFEAITVSLAAVRTAINGLIDPVIPPLPTQALQTLYVVENNLTAANNGVWSANGVGRGLLPFELPDGADNSGFQAKDCTGAWAPAKRGRLSPSNNGTVFNLCNVKWRRTDAPPPILTEAADPEDLSATGRVKEAEFCVIAQRPSNATLPDGYELCTEAFAGRAGQANQNLAAITSQIEARRGEMNNPGSPINFVFPLPRTPNGIPAFAPASQTLQVVTGGGNARIFSPNGVEATDTRFSFTAAQNAAYGLAECRSGRFELSAQSTVVAGEQQVRIGCTMQWRRLADIPPLSPTPLDDTLATSQNDHCVITQWPTNSAFAADSNNQYCGDLLSGIVPDFGEIFDRLQARVIDHNRELSPSPANPATELFPTTTSARVRLFPYFFANNRMFNDRGVEITETAFNIADPVAAAFNQNRCNAAGLTLTFQSDVAGGVQRVRSVCGVRWAMAAAPLPVKEPPEPPTTASTSGDWCVIQQTPAPADWPLPSNLVRCEDEFAAAGNLADVYRAHDALASTINTRWGAGLQTGDQRGKTLYLFGDTYYYPDGVDPRGAPPAPDYGNYTPEHCNTVYGAPEYLGAVVGTLQVLTRTCNVPWRTLADSPPPFAPVAATLALDNRASESGEACVMALHPSSQANPPNTIPCSDFEIGSPSFLDISNRIQQRVDQLNGLIFPQSLPDFDPTRPLYFYTGVNPSQLFNENGLQLTGDNFTPPYVGTPAVGFAMADCTAGGWNTGARLIAGGFAEVCEIRWRKTTTIPNIDKDAANLPAATSEGNLCVMRHTMTNPTLPEAAPWCSDLLSPIADSGGAFQNLKTRIDGRTAALNAAGAGIPAFDPTSHRVILAGTRAFSEHGAESVLPADVAVGLTTRNAAFDAAACTNTDVGHRLILHSEVSGVTHILRQYCDVRWRAGSNVPPLAVNPANPPAAFASQGDRCLMATRGTNAPLAGEMWCGGTGGLLSAVDNFRHLYQRYAEWRELVNPLISGSLSSARTGGPELEAGNYETFYHITPDGNLYTSNGIPIRRAGLEATQFVRQLNGSFFRAEDCANNNLTVLTLAFNTGRPTGDLLIGRYCDLEWRIAATAPPLDKDATEANLPSPTSQGSRCLMDQNPDFGGDGNQPTPDGVQWCHDLFHNTASDVQVDSFSSIYTRLQARQGELNRLAATTDDDFPEIPKGAEPLWIVGTPPVIFHSTGIKANNVELALPGGGTGFTMLDCDNTFGAGKASVRVTSDPANGQPVVQRICAVEWRRMADAPGLSRAVISGPFTEQGSNCVLSQRPLVTDTPLPAGQHLCSALFGGGGTSFADLEINRTNRTFDVDNILTTPIPTYPSTEAAASRPYILSGSNVYSTYGVPINSETYAPTFNGSGASWDAATCHNVIATGDTPPVDIVAGGIAKLCNMRWRRVDSAPDVIFGNPETVPVSSLPPQSATATRKQGNQCVWQHTHDSIDDFPNNYELCETLFSAGGTYSGWNNFNLDGYVGPLTQLGVAYGSGLGNGFNTGFATILGTMIFSPYGIQAGGDYSQKGATTNWPTSTRTTRTTICGTGVSAVGRAEGQNVIVSCPTQWRRLDNFPAYRFIRLPDNRPRTGTNIIDRADYCIISQSDTPTDEQTAERCDAVFGDVPGGIQRIVDDAVQSHGYLTAISGLAANPATPTNTGIYWIHGTDIYSPFGIKLQGGTNVDYVLSAPTGQFTTQDCTDAGWSLGTATPFPATSNGLYQTCSMQIAYVPTPPPLGTTPAPPAHTSQLLFCDIAKTPNVPERGGFSCANVFADFTDFTDITTKAEARRTQINALIPGTIPTFDPDTHTLYIVNTGAARGVYTGHGVPIMDNLRLTSPLGGWTAESCTAAGYTVGGRLSNGNLYQTCSVGGGFANSRPDADASSSFNFQGHGSVFASCVIARTPGATLGTNEHLCSTLLGTPNLGNFANFEEIVNALEARRLETNLVRPGQASDAARYDPAGYQSDGGLLYQHPLVIVQSGANAGIYVGTGVKADKQSAYVPQVPGFGIADCEAAGWSLRVTGGYVQCQIPYLYVNTPPPLGATPNPPTNTVGGSADCTITATRGSPITNSRRCNVVLGSTSGFQDAITKFNARRDEYNAVFADDIPAFAFNSTVYVVQTGANAGVYTQHGLRATDTRLFAPETDAFTIADCTASGHSIGVSSVGGNNYVNCQVPIYTVPNKPPLANPANPPSIGTATGIANSCAITQTPGANPAGGGPTCASLIGSHASNFSQMVSRFEAQRTEYNGVFDPDIPAYAPGNTLYRVASGADAGLYTENGLQATDSTIFDAVAGDFTIADCTASGHRLNVSRNANTGDVSVNCVMIVWTVDTKPPLANPANPPARPPNTGQESQCRITQTPGSPSLPAGSFTCAQLLGAHVSSFSQMTDRFTARRGEYNDFNAPNNIPNYVPWDGASSNVDSILYRVVSGADAGLYTRYGIPASTDSVVPVLFDSNIDTADCAAGGRTATQREVNGVVIAECSGNFFTGVNRPPYFAWVPGGNSLPSGGTQYSKCAYAALPEDGTLPTDTIKCNEFLSSATSGIADFAEFRTRYEERRNELNTFHDNAHADNRGTRTSFDAFQSSRQTYLVDGQLYFWTGIHVRDTAYNQAAESGSGLPGHEEGGFTAADCTAAGYSVSTTETLSYDGIRWPVNICTARYIQRSASDTPPAQNNEKAYPDAEHATRSESGCYLSLPAPNIRAENRTWTTRRCQFLYGVGTSFTNLKARAEEVKNNFNRTISGSAAVPSHPQADPWIIQLRAGNAPPTLVYTIYGLRISGRRASHISEPDPLDDIFTGGIENFGRQECLDAGWKLGETNDNAANDLHEICNILWRRRTTVAPTPPTTPTPPEEQSAAAAASSPGALGFQDEFRAAPVFSSPSPLAEDDIVPQTHEGKPHDYCITRHAKISSAPPPSDMQCGNVFAQHGGFPRLTVIQKAAADRGLVFDSSTDALSIDENGKVILVKEDESGKMIEVPIPKPLGASPATPASSGGGGGGGGGAAIGIGVGSAAILGLLAYSLQSGAVGAGAGLGEFNWSPDISFAYNNTGMREIRYGTRMDFRHTDWHIWWTASQINSSGETKKMRYGSGAQYSADWWSARYNNSIHDKEARADVALKATGEFRDWGGVWKFSPTYRANVEVDEHNIQTWSHRVNLEAVWRINKWTLTQSTGFTAKKASDIGETLQTRLKLTREF